VVHKRWFAVGWLSIIATFVRELFAEECNRVEKLYERLAENTGSVAWVLLPELKENYPR